VIPEGFHIHHYKEVSSTNREALDLIDKGISNETVIIADKQTEGRGHTGKSWVSPEGNFYGSLIVNLFNDYLSENQFSVSFQRVTLESSNQEAWIPVLSTGMTSDGAGITVGLTSQVKDISKLTELTFVTTLAVGNTLLSFMNDSNIQYKWPNDVLVDCGRNVQVSIRRTSYLCHLRSLYVTLHFVFAPLTRTSLVVLLSVDRRFGLLPGGEDRRWRDRLRPHWTAAR
jgi:BirA family biotin operon repressor/biotin-[acetyl-CoA-carboxylase] ligase